MIQTCQLIISMMHSITKSVNLIIRRKLIKQLFKYSFVGIFNTLIGLGTIFVLYNIYKVNYILSNILGYALGLINSFIWNKRWTFASKEHYSKEIFSFIIIFIISYSFNLLSVLVSVELFKINPNIAQLIGVCVYSTTNFFSNRRWTFKS